MAEFRHYLRLTNIIWWPHSDPVTAHPPGAPLRSGPSQDNPLFWSWPRLCGCHSATQLMAQRDCACLNVTWCVGEIYPKGYTQRLSWSFFNQFQSIVLCVSHENYERTMILCLGKILYIINYRTKSSFLTVQILKVTRPYSSHAVSGCTRWPELSA